MSQQHRDPQEVLQALQQPTSLRGGNAQSDFEPFSIREYVLASRQKDKFHSWPFPEKCLRVFLDHGIETVLPPFEPHHLALQSLSGHVARSNGSRLHKQNVASCDRETHRSSAINHGNILEAAENLNKSDEMGSEIHSQDCHQDQSYVHPCNGAVDLTKCVTAQRKKDKVKHKEKSIVDLLNVAKPCTSQNLGNRRLRRSLRKSLRHGAVKIKHTTNVEKNCESELTEDRYLKVDECEGAAIDMFQRKKLVLKFKFKGRNSQNSRNTNLKGRGIKFLRLQK